MTIPRSLYASQVTVVVPDDFLPPKPPAITGVAQQGQQDKAVTHGRSLITLNWNSPTENEDIGGEFLVVADGLAQQIGTTYDPITAHTVFDMAGFRGGGFGDTTLSAGAAPKDKQIIVTSAANFNIGDFIQIDDGTNREYVQIAGIAGSTLTLETRLLCCGVTFPSGTTTVKEVNTATTKTEGVDYNIMLLTGVIDILVGQFTSGNDIVAAYTTTIQDLAGYILLRNQTLLVDTSHANVIADGGTVVVDSTIGAGATTFQETLTAAENGETWFYYLYSFDDETASNISEVMLGGPLPIEMLPSIPQNVSKQVGGNSVKLSWDSLGPGGSDANADGFNIYRNSGPTLDPSSLRKLNAIVIPAAQQNFSDNAAGVTSGDRVPGIPLPLNGQTFTYVIESEDTVTTWDTGTQNQRLGQGAVAIAVKTP